MENSLFDRISNELKSKLDAYKKIIPNSVESLENDIRRIKGEIDVKIESIKMEFDKISESMYDSLDQLKEKAKIIFEKNEIEAYVDKIEIFENVQKELKTEPIDDPIDSNRLYYYQDKIKELNDYIEKYKRYSPVVNFRTSSKSMELNKEFVGEIKYSETHWTFPESTRKVSLKASANGKFLTAEWFGNAPLIANRNWNFLWEYFKLISNTDGTVSLQAKANHKYVCADNDGNGPLIANRDVINDWAKFTLHKHDDGTYSFKAKINNKFVTIENMENPQLIAKSDFDGTNESFEIIEI